MDATTDANNWTARALERLADAGYRRGGARQQLLTLMGEQRCALSVRRGRGHHHHLLCENCGRVEPFADDGLERAIARLSERVPLTVSEHEVLLRGACQACAA